MVRPEPPRFDSDKAALVERAELNAARSIYDLEDWIISKTHPAEAGRILDLGCGTGKQLFALANAAPAATIVGLDISEEAVEAVNDRASKDGFSNVRALRGALDDCPECLGSEPFDLILSSYAIYYATNMVELLQDMAELLTPNGQLFVCGPGRGTNQEMIELVNQFEPRPEHRTPSIDDFIDESSLNELRSCYGSVEISRLANVVKFVSPEEVLGWWRNHNSYRSDLEKQVTDEVSERFRSASVFELSKSVLAVHCRTV